MRLRFLLPALMIGASLLLPVQTPASAKTKSYKFKKYKAHKFKPGKRVKVKRIPRSKVEHPR